MGFGIMPVVSGYILCQPWLRGSQGKLCRSVLEDIREGRILLRYVRRSQWGREAMKTLILGRLEKDSMVHVWKCNACLEDDVCLLHLEWDSYTVLKDEGGSYLSQCTAFVCTPWSCSSFDTFCASKQLWGGNTVFPSEMSQVHNEILW